MKYNKEIYINILFKCVSIIHEQNLNLQKNDITLKRFRDFSN